jgi:hypothetical protein
MKSNLAKQLKPALFVLNDPAAPRLSPQLAKEIGLNESILLLQIEFWIRTSTAPVQENRRWTYQSVRHIQETFEFWSLMTINRGLQSLVKKGLLTVGNFNTLPGDSTRWFSLNEQGISKLNSVRVAEYGAYQNDTPSSQSDTTAYQNGTTLPENTTETTSEITSSIKNNSKKASSKSKDQELLSLPKGFPSLDNDEFRIKWAEWVAYRKEIKHGLTETTAKKQLQKLSGWKQPSEVIEQSMVNGWQGLFELKQEKYHGNGGIQGDPHAYDHVAIEYPEEVLGSEEFDGTGTI